MVSMAARLVAASLLALAAAQRPTDVPAVAGGLVTLGCGLEGGSEGCQWFRSGSSRALELADLPRFRLAASRGCSLVISPVQPIDDGEYECEVAGRRSPASRLTVTAEPGVPHIRQGRLQEELEVASEVSLQLDCESQGGKPAAELEWRQDGRPVTELQKITEHVTRQESTNTWRSVSTFTFVPTTDSTVTCLASSQGFPGTKESQPLKVKVRYRPKVQILVNRDVVREGDSFEVLCKSRAFPQEVGYRWFFSGAELKGMVNNSILIEEISRMYDQRDISCLVENEEGRGEASTRLDVRYAPTILLHPRNQIAKRKDNVTFHCVAEGNPTPEYLWTRGRQDSLVQAGRQNLSLVASEGTEAVYRCQVFSAGNEIVASLPASLTLIRKPVLDADTEREGILGKIAILECRTRSVSNRTRIVWLRGQEPLQPGAPAWSPRHKVVEQWMEREQRTTLLIRHLVEADFGEYGCFAENEVGTDLHITRLVEAAGVNILNTLIGITVAVGLLLLLGIFLYYRVRRACQAGKY